MKFSNRSKITGSILIFLYIITLIMPVMSAYRAIATTEESTYTLIEPNVESDITNQKPNYVENYLSQNSSINFHGVDNLTDNAEYEENGHYKGVMSFNEETPNEFYDFYNLAVNDNIMSYIMNEKDNKSKILFTNSTYSNAHWAKRDIEDWSISNGNLLEFNMKFNGAIETSHYLRFYTSGLILGIQGVFDGGTYNEQFNVLHSDGSGGATSTSFYGNLYNWNHYRILFNENDFTLWINNTFIITENYHTDRTLGGSNVEALWNYYAAANVSYLYDSIDYSSAEGYYINRNTEINKSVDLDWEHFPDWEEGYYQAEYNFNEEVGVNNTDIRFIDNDYSGANENCSVISEIDNHKNVLGFIDNGGERAFCENYIPISQTSGTIEFWAWVEEFHVINIRSDSPNNLYLFFDYNNNRYRLFNSTVYHNEVGYSAYASEWHHYRIDFDFNSDSISIYLDNEVLFDSIMCENIAQMDYFRCYTSTAFTSNNYMDGIDYSWESEYFINRNTLENATANPYPANYQIVQEVEAQKQDGTTYQTNGLVFEGANKSINWNPRELTYGTNKTFYHEFMGTTNASECNITVRDFENELIYTLPLDSIGGIDYRDKPIWVRIGCVENTTYSYEIMDITDSSTYQNNVIIPVISQILAENQLLQTNFSVDNFENGVYGEIWALDSTFKFHRFGYQKYWEDTTLESSTTRYYYNDLGVFADSYVNISEIALPEESYTMAYNGSESYEAQNLNVSEITFDGANLYDSHTRINQVDFVNRTKSINIYDSDMEEYFEVDWEFIQLEDEYMITEPVGWDSDLTGVVFTIDANDYNSYQLFRTFIDNSNDFGSEGLQTRYHLGLDWLFYFEDHDNATSDQLYTDTPLEINYTFQIEYKENLGYIDYYCYELDWEYRYYPDWSSFTRPTFAFNTDSSGGFPLFGGFYNSTYQLYEISEHTSNHTEIDYSELEIIEMDSQYWDGSAYRELENVKWAKIDNLTRIQPLLSDSDMQGYLFQLNTNDNTLMKILQDYPLNITHFEDNGVLSQYQDSINRLDRYDNSDNVSESQDRITPSLTNYTFQIEISEDNEYVKLYNYETDWSYTYHTTDIYEYLFLNCSDFMYFGGHYNSTTSLSTPIVYNFYDYYNELYYNGSTLEVNPTYEYGLDMFDSLTFLERNNQTWLNTSQMLYSGATYDSHNRIYPSEYNISSREVMVYDNTTWIPLELNCLEIWEEPTQTHPNQFDNDCMGFVFQINATEYGYFTIQKDFPSDSSYEGIRPNYHKGLDWLTLFQDNANVSADWDYMEDISEYNETFYTFQIEIHNRSGYVDIWNYEFDYYKRYYTSYDSIPYFLFEPDSDRNSAMYFAGYYNSTHPLLRKQNFGYYYKNYVESFDYTLPSLASAGYSQYFEQLTNFTITYNDNVSTNPLDFSGVRYAPLYNLTIEAYTPYNTSTFEYSEVNGTSFSINSSYFSNEVVSEEYSIDLELDHYAYSTVDYQDHNISIVFEAKWSVYIREDNPSLLEFGFDILTPFLVFIMFPIAFKDMGSTKGKLLGTLIGSAVGFFIMGYIGYMSLINGILLAMLSLFSLFALYRRDSQI